MARDRQAPVRTPSGDITYHTCDLAGSNIAITDLLPNTSYHDCDAARRLVAAVDLLCNTSPRTSSNPRESPQHMRHGSDDHAATIGQADDSHCRWHRCRARLDRRSEMPDAR